MGALTIFEDPRPKGGQILILQNNCSRKSFLSNRDKENEPNIIRIGPLIRKLVFWGAHTIFESSRPKRGSNINFTQKCSGAKFFVSPGQRK